MTRRRAARTGKAGRKSREDEGKPCKTRIGRPSPTPSVTVNTSRPKIRCLLPRAAQVVMTRQGTVSVRNRGGSWYRGIMQLAVVGTGYVGLVAGAGFSDFGNDVACVDVDAHKIARLQRGEVPIYEPGLDALIAKNVKAGRLRFSTEVAEAVRGAEVVFIAVGTPPAAD